MKLRVQAQHLQPGDIVGSGEYVVKIYSAGIGIPSGKCEVVLRNESKNINRAAHWGRYTMIGVERDD